MNENQHGRAEALRDLIELRRPVVQGISALDPFPWDAPHELVELTRGHVKAAIRQCLDRTISPEELRAWAEALEDRDDVGYQEGGVDLREVLFELATPELFGELTVVISAVYDRLP